MIQIDPRKLSLPSLVLLGAWALLGNLATAAPSDEESGDWPLFRGDPGLSGIAKGEIPSQPEVLWTAYTEAAIASSPVIKDGRAFVGSDDQSLYAFDVKDGSKLWSVPTDDIIEAPPSVIGDTVYVGSNDGFLYAVDAASGELRWKFETEAKIAGAVNTFNTPEGPRIVFGSYDSRLYTLDPATGEKVWTYQSLDRINGTPAISGDSILFGGCDSYLHRVSTQSGKALARLELGEACHVAGSVAVRDGRVYFGHYGMEFLCYDLAQEEVLWNYQSRRDFFAAPAVSEDRVIFGGRDKKLHCLDRKTGDVLWTHPSRRKIDSSVVICGDKLVFGSGDGKLIMLRVETGEEIWSYEVGRALFSSPAVAHGRIYIGAHDGGLYCFGEKKTSEGSSKGKTPR